MEETLDAEVGNCKAQHGQLVQLGDDIRGEWQQAGQPVQLSIQPVSVPLGRVGFLIGSRRLPDDETDRGERDRRGLNGHRDVCVDRLVTIRSHAFSCKIRIVLAKWPQINLH